MTSRHLTTAVTLAALCVVLVIGAVVGFNALFAPLPSGSDEPAAEPSTGCRPTPHRLHATDVTVNVLNAGTRVGLANDTLEALHKRGFLAGMAGNAPTGTKVVRAQVWIQPGEADAGRLVGRQLGLHTPVVKGKKDLGEGVDVVLGNGFKRLLFAPRSVKQRHPGSSCS